MNMYQSQSTYFGISIWNFRNYKVFPDIVEPFDTMTTKREGYQKSCLSPKQEPPSPPPLILPRWMDCDWGYLFEPATEKEEYVCAYSESLQRSKLCPENRPHCYCGQAGSDYLAAIRTSLSTFPSHRAKGTCQRHNGHTDTVEKLKTESLNMGKPESSNNGDDKPIMSTQENANTFKPTRSSDETMQFIDVPCPSSSSSTTEILPAQEPQPPVLPSYKTAVFMMENATKTQNFSGGQVIQNQNILAGGPPGVFVPPPNQIAPPMSIPSEKLSLPRPNAVPPPSSSLEVAPFKVMSRNNSNVVFRFPNDAAQVPKYYKIMTGNGNVYRVSSQHKQEQKTSDDPKDALLNPADMVDPPNVTCISLLSDTPATTWSSSTTPFEEPQIFHRGANASVNCGGQIEALTASHSLGELLMNPCYLEEFSKMSLDDISLQCNLNEFFDQVSSFLNLDRQPRGKLLQDSASLPVEQARDYQPVKGPLTLSMPRKVKKSTLPRKNKRRLVDPLAGVEDHQLVASKHEKNAVRIRQGCHEPVKKRAKQDLDVMIKKEPQKYY
ncbi:uncharacterized protein LOC110843411 isoform X2 [Folsomia candida]|uniref:uncharacterized protein LOC110843411 isoform X2 n=1 Tax=Folsomia candida TaxID=158441 RepID=UPI000B90418C|nr:uncharacterized protein LOC110843411 isoform X2 [Folsomia candida]